MALAYPGLEGLPPDAGTHALLKRAHGWETPGYNLCLVTPRRWGKSILCITLGLHLCYIRAGAQVIYLGKSRGSAWKNIWERLKGMVLRFWPSAYVNDSKLFVRLPNGSKFFVDGCDNTERVGDLRGTYYDLAIIDEAKEMERYLPQLVKDALGMTMMERLGRIVMIGTPDVTRAGFFGECSLGLHGFRALEGARHGHNTFLLDQMSRFMGRRVTEDDIHNQLAERYGLIPGTPTFRREVLGEWCEDPAGAVFGYDPTQHSFTEQELEKELGPFKDRTHVIGVDTGWTDMDAYAVLACNPKKSDKAFLVYEETFGFESWESFMTRLKGLVKTFNPQVVTYDWSNGAKKMAPDFLARTGVLLEDADKRTAKLEQVLAMDTDIRAGRLRIRSGRECAHEMSRMHWVRSKDASKKMTPGGHSDIVDAVRYAWKRCMHFLHVPPKPDPLADYEVGSPERRMREMEMAEDAAFRRSLRGKQRHPAWARRRT